MPAARAHPARVQRPARTARPSRRLNTWDRTVLPLPFGRGAVVWVGPLFVGETDDEEAIRRDWQDRLLAADSRAEALIA